MPSTMPLSRTASCTSSVMSRTVSPPVVRSCVSRWKTFIAGILAERPGTSTGEPALSAEPAPEAPAGRREPPGGSQLCFQATEKEPLLEIAPVWAFVTEPETMSIRSGLKVESETPFAVADVKLTLPKFVSGNTPLRLDGASAITSAEASAALFKRCVVWNVQRCVESVIVRVNRPTPSVVTEAVNASPGRTGEERFTGYFGYISYQA